MKIRLIFVVPFIFFSASSQLNDSDSFNWDGLHKLLIQYHNRPNRSNTLKVYDYLSGYHTSNKRTDTLGLSKTFELAWAQTGILEQQVYSGKRYAVKLCFKMFTIADGAFAEDLDIILTKLIKINPKLFLQELIVHRNLFGSGLGFQNYGQEFVDCSDLARQKETQKHIRALESVKDSSLIEIRNEMIKAYKE